jgi:hypothetical protein
MGSGQWCEVVFAEVPEPHSLVESVLLHRFSKLITAEQKLSIQRDVHFGGPKMDEKGLAVRKWPEAPARFTEIYRARA